MPLRDGLPSSKRIAARSASGVTAEERWAAIEDAGRLRDASELLYLSAFLTPSPNRSTDPLGDLVSRYARSHGPFTTSDVAQRFGLGVGDRHRRSRAADRRAAGSTAASSGPAAAASSGVTPACCDRSADARWRGCARKSSRWPASTFGRFLPAWQHARNPLRGVDGVLRAVEQLQGAVLPASALEQLVLPSRVADYTPAMLDELTVSGDVVWAGRGALPGNDGWVALYPAESATAAAADPRPAT